MNNDKLFREALLRQNERAAGMKMPDDMEQRVMRSLKPQPAKRRWLYPASALAIAASVLLLIMLNTGKQQPEQPPVIAEEVTVPKDNMEETPQATVSAKVIEQPAEAEEPQPAKKRRKVHMPKHEEPVPEEPETEQEYLPTESDPFLLAAAFEQDVRSRGERLYLEVVQMINNH